MAGCTYLAPVGLGQCLGATRSRCCASCARSSGVRFAPKSSASNTRRISISSLPFWNGERRIHSMASSMDFTCHSQKPAISSLVSVNGPSVTVLLPPPNLTRTPFALEHPAGLHQLFVELAHLGEKLPAGQHAGLRLLVRLHDHHDSHDWILHRLDCR